MWWRVQVCAGEAAGESIRVERVSWPGRQTGRESCVEDGFAALFVVWPGLAKIEMGGEEITDVLTARAIPGVLAVGHSMSKGRWLAKGLIDRADFAGGSEKAIQ